jgi:hypothetical protein
MPIVAQARPTRPAPQIPMGSSVESRFSSEPIRESFSSSSAKAASTPFKNPRFSDVKRQDPFMSFESEGEISSLRERKQREMSREPIDVRGVSKETAKRAFEFSQNPEQEFIISRPSKGGKSKSTSSKETVEL